jgi:hypothetical protein
MSKYLLICGCGNAVPVEIGQSGGQTACPACGAPLEVPPLRKLRHLPVAAAETKSVRATWGARQGIVTASFVLAAILAAIAAWSRFTEPTVRQFDPNARLEAVDQGLDQMTPLEGWQLWIELYRPLAERGFAIIEDPHKPAIERHVAQQRFLQKTLLAAAAVFLAIALAAALWPRTTTRHLAATR